MHWHSLADPAEGRRPQVVTYYQGDGPLTASNLKRSAGCQSDASKWHGAGEAIAVFGVPRPPERDSMMAPDETSCPDCFDRVVAHIRLMIEESGDPVGFDVVVWTAAWIERPLPALGGQTPHDAMQSKEGCELVLTLVDRMQSGTYS